MKIFQVPYNWFKSWTTPVWLRDLLQALQDLMVDVARKAGENYILYIESLIAEAASHNEWSNSQKFEYVFDKAKNGGVSALIVLKDNEISALVNFLYSQYKKLRGE